MHRIVGLPALLALAFAACEATPARHKSAPDALVGDAAAGDAVPADVAAATGSTAPAGGYGGVSCVAPYTEELTPPGDLKPIKAAYTAAGAVNAAAEVLALRYAHGRYIVAHPKVNGDLAPWLETGTWKDFVQSLSTGVHEVNHQLGFALSDFTTYAYVVREDAQFDVPMVGTYDRSAIAEYLNADDQARSQYFATYFTGQMGAQGFETLLDELNAYIHTTFTDLGVIDQMPKGLSISSRDGVVSFLYFTELYLRHGREKEKATWEKMRATPQLVALIRLLWARANFILEKTAANPQLGLDDAYWLALALAPENVAELNAFLCE